MYNRYSCQDIDDDDIQAVIDALRSDFITQGPLVKKFEERIRTYCGAQGAVAVSSGTAALHAVCAALGLGDKDLVWTSPISFVASANCALYVNAQIDFVDVDPQDGNISLVALREKLTVAKRNGRLPSVLIPVHFAGRPPPMNEIWDLACEFKFKVIEDAAHSFGANYSDGSPVGCCKFSHATVLSFHPVKTITTAEGGMILTRHAEFGELVRGTANHGITRDRSVFVCPNYGDYYYEQHSLGFNYRLTELQAALGLSQMNKLAKFIARRRELAESYNELLSKLMLRLPPPDPLSAWHLYVVGVGDSKQSVDRDLIFNYLRSRNIGVNVHYIPIHMQPYYQKLGFKIGQFPNAEKFFATAISLPLHVKLNHEDQNYVVAELKKALHT